MNVIALHVPITQVVDEHPEVLDVFVKLGFKPLANPVMCHTVGIKVSIKQGVELNVPDVTII